jgi:hypothetical protein
MNFPKINLEHQGAFHVPSKYVDLFRKYFQLTKEAIVSHVNCIFSIVKICEYKVFRVFNFISIAKNKLNS